ncbi:MAG: 16S rRNA (guanine(966)-N(2))-methyltransferase RsmD [Candidatus Binatia bacterium]
MRVIGGKAKGHLLKVPKGQTLRPTAARVKEALFNILPHNLSGYKVLDLFAGSGNLSVEALSRGAAQTILVDTSHKAGVAIHYNLEVLGFLGRSEVWIASVLPSLRLLSRRGMAFDLIFLDPPYERNWIGRVLKVIAQGGLLREGGLVVVEHSVREEVKKDYAEITLQDQRRYGDTLLSFLGHVKTRPQ